MITERAYTSDQDAYEVFVGQVTPHEFLQGYEEFECPYDEAIQDFFRNWPHADEAPPSWLQDALYRYVGSAIDAE